MPAPTVDGVEQLRLVTANGIDFACLEAGPPGGPPALCLHGFPDTARSIGAGMLAESAALCTGECQVEVLEGCGHFLHLERPDEVLGLVTDFLGDA